MRLSDYLRASSRGDANCGLFVADWVLARTGIDPSPEDRGKPVDREWGWGGLARHAGRQMGRAGFRLTREARPGDVGVVALPGHVVCAIRTERGWAMRIGDRLNWLALDAVRVIAAWRL